MQEISAVQFFPNLPVATNRQITDGAALFPWILEHAQFLTRMQIPPNLWPIFLNEETDKFVSNGCVRCCTVLIRFGWFGWIDILGSVGSVIPPAECGDKTKCEA